jgi:chlorobactene glucosyltransferase
MSALVPVVLSLPFVLPQLGALLRAAHSRSLNDVSDRVALPAPLVSVVIPARNERRNIERCVRSVLSTTYPALEVIVVDDHSTDGTGDVARAVAAEDSRLRVIAAPELPSGWFGKQWACATGAGDARGELLLFADADTWHAPDLAGRAVNTLRERRADLVTVAGHQEMHSFWERVIQPQVFGMLAMRFGGTESVSNTRVPANAIANGQFMLVRRAVYDELHGHERVRDRVAEDLSMAQEWVRAGKRLVIVLGTDQLSTHMYASLRELIAGWRKNIYAGGRLAVLGGWIGRALFPFVLLAAPLLGLVAPIALVASLAGLLSSAWLLWSVIVVAGSLVFWAIIYRFMREPVLYALVYPLGAAMLAYIAAGAIVRGQRVEWKQRTYTSS